MMVWRRQLRVGIHCGYSCTYIAHLRTWARQYGPMRLDFILLTISRLKIARDGKTWHKRKWCRSACVRISAALLVTLVGRLTSELNREHSLHKHKKKRSNVHRHQSWTKVKQRSSQTDLRSDARADRSRGRIDPSACEVMIAGECQWVNTTASQARWQYVCMSMSKVPIISCSRDTCSRPQVPTVTMIALGHYWNNVLVT